MFRSMHIPTVIIALFFFMLSTACGGFTSLDSNLQASQMSDEEAATYCQEAEEYLADEFGEDEQHKMVCMFAALIGSLGGEDACQEAYDDCLAEDYDFSEEDDFVFGESAMQCTLDQMDRSDCQATVGELEACWMAQVDGLLDNINNFSCSDLSETDLEADYPVECQPVLDKC